MIVYNIDRCWFPLKADAEAFRKALGLPPSKLHKLNIETREELAVLLNGLMGLKEVDQDLIPQGAPMEPEISPKEIIDENVLLVPEYVPMFLARAYANGKKIVRISSEEMEDDS